MGLSPRPHWGAYSAPPDPLAEFNGPTSKERVGRKGAGGKGRKEKKKGGEREGKRGGEGGEGRECASSVSQM